MNSSAAQILSEDILPEVADLFSWYHDSEPILQPVWTAVLARSEWFSSPLFPIALALFCYFGSTVPFTVLDLYGYQHWRWVRATKIQPDVQVRPGEYYVYGVTYTGYFEILKKTALEFVAYVKHLIGV